VELDEMTDISATELKNKRFQLLEDIAKELQGDIVFPTCFDVSARISEIMRSDSASLRQIAQEIQHDPLVTSKILQLANSASYNPSGHSITDIEKALNRTGLEIARSVALACALTQLAQTHETSIFAPELKQLLIHSLKTAAIAKALALKLTRVAPETAMLAGLIHDLGAFFILHRVTRYPELVERPESVSYLVAQWHESIGTILLDALGLPTEIINAVQEIDIPRVQITQPRNLSEIVYIANLFAGGFSEIQKLDLPNLQEPLELKDPRYTALSTDMDEACAEILNLW
jgi:HD-like signal output (HDOD) protein